MLGMDFTLRYAMIHMIQETARHCGHLDLLRETTDGAVGMSGAPGRHQRGKAVQRAGDCSGAHACC